MPIAKYCRRNQLDPTTHNFYFNDKRIKATDTPKSLEMQTDDIIRVEEEETVHLEENSQKSNDTDVLFPLDAEDNDGNVEADVDDNNNNKEYEGNSKSLLFLLDTIFFHLHFFQATLLLLLRLI